MTNTVRHIITAVVITLVLFFSGIFVFAASVPVFYLFAVYGRKTGWYAALALFLTATIGMFSGYLDSVSALYFVYFWMIAVVLGEAVARHYDLIKVVTLATLVPVIVGAVIMIVSQFGFGVPLFDTIRFYLSGAMDDVLKMQETIASLSSPQIAYLQQNKEEIVNFMMRVIPSTTVLFGMLVVSLSLLLTRSFGKKFHVLRYFGNVLARPFPFWPVWVTITCGLAFFLNVYLVHNVVLKYVAVNGLIICAGIFFIQGCFVISFWLHKGRSPFIRLLVYGLIIAFLQIVGIFIVALGLSDQWLGFRKKIQS
jgi:hypothetical protein